MVTALSAIDYIYEGVWVNWSQDRGAVLGSTLTISPNNAAIISPAIAVLISIAGSQLWRLFQFALHQIRATSGKKSLLYHQQQVILRNTATDLNAIWKLARIAIAWRHQKDIRPLRRSMPVISWAVVHFVLIVLFGLFSSWLLETSDEVLSRSPFCGTWSDVYVGHINSDDLTAENIKMQMEYTTYHNARYASVQQHVDICQTSVDGCNTLPTAKLDWTSSVLPNVCPFGDMCHSNVDGSIYFDTGFLSSTKDLGYNAQSQDRVSFRMVATCSPMDDAKYTTDWQQVAASDTIPTHQVADALYGPSQISARNATYSQAYQYAECDQRQVLPAYTMNSQAWTPGETGWSTFDPLPDLKSADADVSLMLLYFNNVYQGAVTDPWFSATQQINDTNAFCIQEDKTFYARDRPLTTLGCSQQWQICNSDASSLNESEQCTPLLGLNQVQEQLAGTPSMPLSSRQLVTANRIINSAMGSSFYYIIDSLTKSAGPPLKARNLIADTAGLPLPSNQWHNETSYWVDLLLALVQQVNLDFSTGQFAASTSYINVTTPEQAEDYWLCQSQIIHSKSYRNFNFFALVLTVALCVIIIALGVSIEDLIGYIRQRNLRYIGPNRKQDMWIANSDLELLRSIDESNNGTTWAKSQNGVPLAPPGYRITVDDLKTNSYDVQKGTGVVLSSVKRHQETQGTNGLSLYKHSHKSGHKGCATCSTFEVSPTDSDPSPTKDAQSSARNTEETSTTHTFENAFRRSIPHADELTALPKATITETPSPPKTASSEALPPQQRPKKRLPITISSPSPPTKFSYRNSIPHKDAFKLTTHEPQLHPSTESIYSQPGITSPNLSRQPQQQQPFSFFSHGSQPVPAAPQKNQYAESEQVQVYSPPEETATTSPHRLSPPEGWGVLPRSMTGLSLFGNMGSRWNSKDSAGEGWIR